MIEAVPLLAWPPGRPVLTILLYHRVLPAFDPMRPGEVVADNFERHMAFIARHFTVLPLVDAADALKRGALPQRALCITFDDGYADNLSVALPILERFNLPATVFVAAGYLDGGRMFNDSATEVVARAAGPVLDLRDLGLDRYPIANDEERLRAIDALLPKLKYLAPDEREGTIRRMAEAAGCGSLPTDLMLTSDQVRELSARGVEIGGHTVDHTILTTIDDAGARAQVAEGKRKLEMLTGKRIKSFAYPNGRPGRDLSAGHVGMVRELGFDVAVTTAYGVGNGDSDVFQLPRFSPWGTSVLKSGARLVRNAWIGRPASVC
jgi:peptidoglycan/xylan/chitin deacetylase (PgdA/CDA1 family)